MRNLFVGLTCATVASLFAYPALAEKWQWFPVKGGAVAFDQDSLKTDITTGAVAAHTVIFYDPPKPVGPARYSFVAERLEFECRSDRHRWSQSAILDVGGAVIITRPDGDWTKIGTEKGSTGLFKRMLCMAQTPPGGKQAKDLATLIVAVRASVPPAAPVAKPSAVPAPTAPAPAPQTTLPKTPAPKTAATTAAPKAAPKTAASANNGKPPPLDLDALVANLTAVSEANATATIPTLPAPVKNPAAKAPVAKAPIAKPPVAKAPAPKAKAADPALTKPMPKLRPLTTP